MTKYIRKDIVPIEAFQLGVDNMPDWFLKEVKLGTVILRKATHIFSPQQIECTICHWGIEKNAKYGDYIIKGTSNFIYYKKRDLFERLYEKVEE